MILVTSENLASRLHFSEIKSFEMEEFRGRHLRMLRQALDRQHDKVLLPTQRVLAFTEVIEESINPDSCDRVALMEGLTIFDLWHLVTMQWGATTVPMSLNGACTSPIYSFSRDGQRGEVFSHADLPFGSTVEAVNACGGRAESFLTIDDIEVTMLDVDKAAAPEGLELIKPPTLAALMRDATLSVDNKFDILSLCLQEYDLDELTPKQFMDASRWYNGIQHGVRNIGIAHCNKCARTMPIEWRIGLETFIGG